VNPILEKVLTVQTQIGLCWLGNPSWLIRAERKFLAIDLDLDGNNRLNLSPIPAAELAPVLDIQFITHEHGDNSGETTSRILSEQPKCAFVVPTNCVEMAEKIGVPNERITVARPHQPFKILDIPVETQGEIFTIDP